MIAKRAGIAVGTLYGYFENKRDILQEGVDATLGEVNALVVEQLAPATWRGRDPREVVRSLIDTIFHIETVRPGTQRVIYERYFKDESFRAIVDARQEHTREAIEGFLDRRAAYGDHASAPMRKLLRRQSILERVFPVVEALCAVEETLELSRRRHVVDRHRDEEGPRVPCGVHDLHETVVGENAPARPRAGVAGSTRPDEIFCEVECFNVSACLARTLKRGFEEESGVGARPEARPQGHQFCHKAVRSVSTSRKQNSRARAGHF